MFKRFCATPCGCKTLHKRDTLDNGVVVLRCDNCGNVKRYLRRVTAKQKAKQQELDTLYEALVQCRAAGDQVR